jgi:DNA-binding XRE family transcriptional regulator
VESASSRHHTKDSSALACDRRRPTAAVAVSQGAQAKRYLRFPYGSGHGLSLLFTRAVPTQQLRYVSAAAAKRDGQRRLAFGRSGVQVDVGGEKRLDHVALAGFGRPHQRRVFATNLRRVRRGRGFSQESLAWEAGINRSYMAKIETGKTWVGLEIICKLAKVLEIEPAELLRTPLRRVRRK